MALYIIHKFIFNRRRKSVKSLGKFALNAFTVQGVIYYSNFISTAIVRVKNGELQNLEGRKQTVPFKHLELSIYSIKSSTIVVDSFTPVYAITIWNEITARVDVLLSLHNVVISKCECLQSAHAKGNELNE